MNLKPAYSALRNFAATLGTGLIDLMYPPHCLGCGVPLDRDEVAERNHLNPWHEVASHRTSDREVAEIPCVAEESSNYHPSNQSAPGGFGFSPLLCERCNLQLPFIKGRVCPTCGHELAISAPAHKRCHACRGKTLNFVSAAAPFRYDGIARSLILQFKLSSRYWLASVLAEYFADRLRQTRFISGIDAIVPVPLHWRRLAKRGYNQAFLLAVEIGRKFRLPVVDCLSRTVNTRTQTAVTAAARMENMRGVFKINKNGCIKNKRILLVDDVITTCATCAECSRVLVRDGGAKSVHVATIARTMFKQ